MTQHFTQNFGPDDEPIVITGVGLLASVGNDRESVWQNVRSGHSGVRSLAGLPHIPDGLLIAATSELAIDRPRRLKVVALCRAAAAEAMADSGVDLERINRDRFGCAISGHMGDTGFIEDMQLGSQQSVVQGVIVCFGEWLLISACSLVANEYGLAGPRICHSTACASGLIDILAAHRSIRDGQCDIALAGSGEGLHPLFAAGFYQMRVLAEAGNDPRQACRPYDVNRSGFVMGEGAAMLVLERLSHARRRGATVYAELIGGTMHAEAHHVTGLDTEADSLAHLITHTLERTGLEAKDIGYINTHGTGTLQNDVSEVRAIRRALGPAADRLCVSSTKSMLGHLVNAAGSVELAITALALRDRFVPPTANLYEQDPQCDLDCVPLVGREQDFRHALKISVAFGGHLVGVTMRRWDESDARPAEKSRAA